ncbi:hypothetical protein GCM10009087_04540 [Sphingomonas oligophenolica]|uniref:Glycosyltransferase RgtA/B/C/D-like domain-containing protein n=1 Tax=Sphingomonas oligophenolica TaxID=301154 RepID=A0ABU9Y5U6_9SPHN
MTISEPVRGPHKVALGLFALIWFSIIWFGSNEYNPNNSTRLFAAISLVENHDATIDEFKTLTIDKAEFGQHVYLDKAPGMTLMAMPAVAIADMLTGTSAALYPKKITNHGLAQFMRLRLRLAVAMSIAILTALAAVLLLDLATGITGNPQAGLVTALGYALATPVWGWSTTLFGHAAVGALLLIATWAIWRSTSSAGTLGRLRYPLIAGAALGWALVIEYPTVIPGLPIVAWAIWRTRTLDWPGRARIFGLTAAAGIIALLPLIAYNEIAFGTLFKVGYSGVVGFDGMNQGFFGLTYPKLAVLGEITFGTARGLFWVAPILFLAPFGIARLIRAPETRDLGLLATAIVILVLLYNASYVYWDGGFSTGPRHSIPMVGFLALGIAPLWRDWRATGRGWIAGLVASGIVLNLAIAATEIAAPSEFRFPLVNPILKGFVQGKIRDIPGDYWGWPPLLGLLSWLAVALPLLWWIVSEARLPVAAPRDIQPDLA